MKFRPFRSLNEAEIELIRRLAKRKSATPLTKLLLVNYADVEVLYQRSDNFTEVVLKLAPNKIALGVSKRNPTDSAINLIGELTALSRAVRSTPITL